MTDPIRILSWNVNGLRSCERKGFRRWLDRSRAWLVGVQEVRARREQLPARVHSPKGWHTDFVAAERAGYSGVGLYMRAAPSRVTHSLGARALDAEGRLQVAHFGKLVVANAYFPNGKGNARDNSRVPYKMRFYRALFSHLEKLRRRGARILVMGDFNTAHRAIDLARPKQNEKISGFLPRERKELDRWLVAGWLDTLRMFEPGAGHYSWWSQRAGVREKNIGWRIDYVLATPNLKKYLRAAFIETKTRGSDHAPVGVELDPRALG